MLELSISRFAALLGLPFVNSANLWVSYTQTYPEERHCGRRARPDRVSFPTSGARHRCTSGLVGGANPMMVLGVAHDRAATISSETPLVRQFASTNSNSVIAAVAGRAAQHARRAPWQVAIAILGMIWLVDGAPDGMPAMCTIFAASLISSTAGFAFSALSGAALFHLASSPARAVEIMLVCSVANQAMMTWSMREHIVWRTVARYASGGIVGVIAGIAMATTIASVTYVLVAGSFLIGFGVYTLVARTPRLPDLHPAFDIIVGLLSGFFGGMLAFPSVLVVIWIGCKGNDRRTQRAIYQPFILLMQIVAIFALVIMAQLRPGSSHFAISDLLYMPVALLGTSIGLRLFSRVSDGQFKAAVSAMLIASGAALVF